jgi:hypothetical protein
MTIHRIATIATLLGVVATSAVAQPGEATLISPSSDVNTTTIAFTWQSAPTATWYHFWLGKVDTSLITEQWYTADHAGCASGGTCAITLTPPLTAGVYIWHIRTWSSAGYGPWSALSMFTVRDVAQAWTGMLPPSRRFTRVLNNFGVLDNETGLVWQRDPYPFDVTFYTGQLICSSAGVGARHGWRVPTLAELKSLFDTSVNNQYLPAGHPFSLTAPRIFWTTTESAQTANLYFAVDFDNGSTHVSPNNSDATRKAWCVRGGG